MSSNLEFGLVALLGLISTIAGMLAMGAVAIGIWYARSESALARRLYWTVFWLTVAGNVAMAWIAIGGVSTFWVNTLVGPWGDVATHEGIEYLNVLTVPLLLVFFSVPFWRRFFKISA